MNWKFTLGVPGPLAPTSMGNFPVTVSYISPFTFNLQSGLLPVNEGDTIIFTNSPMDGTYVVGPGLLLPTIPVTTSIPIFIGIQSADVEIIRPAATIQYTDIEEPVGWDSVVFNVLRDDRWHGVFFEASNSALGFIGAAYRIIKAQKDALGIDAVVIFTASVACADDADFEEAISGKLNFSAYQETCGSLCIIRMPVEQNSCAMIFKNRFDQKVNVDLPKSFNNTNLVQYGGLAMTMELATQDIPIVADADVANAGDVLDVTTGETFEGQESYLIRPTYEIVTDNSILTGQLNDPANVFQDTSNTFALSPQVLLEENADCVQFQFDYDIRLKGTWDVTHYSAFGSGNLELWIIVDYWDGIGSHLGPTSDTGNAIQLHKIYIGNVTALGPIVFDESFAGSFTLPVGFGLYAYAKIFNTGGFGDSVFTRFTMTFDSETSFLLSNTKSCPPTDAQVYLINETLARITESITDRCLTIESEYYGRTDSEPYAETADGCGGLRILTPGLKIRQATDKKFFASMKEVMEGLRAVDNIGMGMESDRIRIEDAGYFYQPVKIMDLLLIPEAKTDIDEARVHSNLKTGYNKWEIKSIKGIDEFNSSKQYRTGIKAINNELDISSNLIASGYIIENLRTLSLVNTGNTDNTYDNDIFIICVYRDAYGYHVEQGITDNAANFFSPTTAYNWRIRPLYNLMRWFKSIAQCYVNLSNTASKLFFTSGTGNYTAEGNINLGDPCVMENMILAENDDLSAYAFQRPADAIPLYKPETITFTYPLSLADYKLIKATPYGYINVQCGTGDTEKAWIKQVEYKVSEGTAEFTLIKAWV